MAHFFLCIVHLDKRYVKNIAYLQIQLIFQNKNFQEDGQRLVAQRMFVKRREEVYLQGTSFEITNKHIFLLAIADANFQYIVLFHTNWQI